MVMKQMKKRSYKIQSLIELGLVITLLVLLNLVLSGFFFRIDLTKENRYSLASASKNLAGKVNDIMFVKVYLEGDFPAGFKRLSKSTKEMLDEFRVYTNGNLQYEFIDPFAEADGKKTDEIIEELSAKGLKPTSVQIKKDDEMAQKIVVPGAIFYYKGKEYPMNLLKAQFGANPEDVINESIELLEYEIANVLRKATEKSGKKIAFIEGHGELERWDVADIQKELEEYYEVKRIPLTLIPPQELSKYAGIIIAKPTQPFSEFDKFKIDQYIMNGGKVLWFLDNQIAEMDSLNDEPFFMSAGYNTKLDDMLFRYGIRVNADLVQDMQCNAIPILSQVKNGNPQQKLLPWLFYPVATSMDNNPIVKNMEPVWFQFASSIDTTANSKMRKTVLLRSSQYSRRVSAPVRVDLNLTRVNPDPLLFNNGGAPLAVLMEGSFSSVFQYRLGATQSDELPYKEGIEHNKMIVVADGDVLRNQRKKTTGEIFPLGFDRYTQQQFGNKRFVLNCVDYLCDDSQLIDVRGKEIAIRLLNKTKVRKEKTMWQLVNMLLPIGILLIFGGVNHFLRKRKYTI
jgi:ABC-2 type transport system permease protein